MVPDMLLLKSLFNQPHPLRTLVFGHEDKVGEVPAAFDIGVAPVEQLVVVDGLEELLWLQPLKIQSLISHMVYQHFAGKVTTSWIGIAA